jgi:hypothetical protein
MFRVRILCIYIYTRSRCITTNFFNLVAFIVVLIICISGNPRKGVFITEYYLRGIRVWEHVWYLSGDAPNTMHTQ